MTPGLAVVACAAVLGHQVDDREFIAALRCADLGVTGGSAPAGSFEASAHCPTSLALSSRPIALTCVDQFGQIVPAEMDEAPMNAAALDDLDHGLGRAVNKLHVIARLVVVIDPAGNLADDREAVLDAPRPGQSVSVDNAVGHTQILVFASAEIPPACRNPRKRGKRQATQRTPSVWPAEAEANIDLSACGDVGEVFHRCRVLEKGGTSLCLSACCEL